MQRPNDGAMPLTEHLRELRTRLVRSAIAIGLGMVAGWLEYPALFALLRRPFDEVVSQQHQENIVLALNGVADPFTLQIQVAAVAGVMVFISIDQLLPTSRAYGKGHDSILGLVAGMAVMSASLLLLRGV